MRGHALKNNKTISLLICCLIVGMIILNGFFMVSHGEHHCTGVHCYTCETLYFAQNMQKLLDATLAVFGFVFLLFQLKHALSVFKTHVIFLNFTLVDQKIRMNN